VLTVGSRSIWENPRASIRLHLAATVWGITMIGIPDNLSLLWRCLITFMQMGTAPMTSPSMRRSMIREKLVLMETLQVQKPSRQTLARSRPGSSRSRSKIPGQPLMKWKPLWCSRLPTSLSQQRPERINRVRPGRRFQPIL